ncbi:proton-conducting transporter membrane subunit, partial [Staphylococcus aureus]
MLFALVQTQLKKLIAYSSVENMGLILMCIAFSLNANVAGQTIIAGMALTAAIMQCLNHGLFKSLLFLSA